LVIVASHCDPVDCVGSSGRLDCTYIRSSSPRPTGGVGACIEPFLPALSRSSASVRSDSNVAPSPT